MDSDLSQAYYGVYTSSKEILKNNQRHLYCNMLDLLTNTCKTTGKTVSKIATDDLVHFWIADIVPLMFDHDRAVQNSAIVALEQSLSTRSLSVSTIHSCIHWPELKAAIITIHAPRIHKLREDRNQSWHQIWCFLIRILDCELLKRPSTLNSFLSIVELGFRSSDNTVRAEAFLCWRLLIQIFFAYDELSSMKRMKLICIPLKSSLSKSPYAATVKFRVWWYFLTCMGPRLGQHFETIVEPFLIFSFGGPMRSVSNAALQYDLVRDMALPCLAMLLSVEPNEFLLRILRDFKLEPLSQTSPLIEPSFLKQHWRPIANAVITAIRVLVRRDNVSESDQQLMNLLLRLILNYMLDLLYAPFCTYICTEIAAMLPSHPRPVVFTLNTIAACKLQLDFSPEDLNNLSGVFSALTNLLIAGKSIVPPAILQRCVDQVFTLEDFQSGWPDWRVLTTVFDIIFQTRDDEDYEAFETKLLIWGRVTLVVLNYLRENSLDYRLKEHSNVLNRWVLWPLHLCVGFAGRRSKPCFDLVFCAAWRQLLNSGQNSLDRHNFLKDVKQALHELLAAGELTFFAELFDGYVLAVMKLSLDNDSLYHTDVFMLLNEALAQPLPQKQIEGCLNTAQNVVRDLKHHEITTVFPIIKSTVIGAVRASLKWRVDTSFFEEWKRGIIEKIRTHSNKNFAVQIKELFKGNDEFVIIPSVWTLNPEKLTERQKERFAEKADIPALYNDMSQSDESSIKPWTPNKIVIAKENQSEIVLERLGEHGQLKRNDKKKESKVLTHEIEPKILQLSSIQKIEMPLNSTVLSPIILLNSLKDINFSTENGDAIHQQNRDTSSAAGTSQQTCILSKRDAEFVQNQSDAVDIETKLVNKTSASKRTRLRSMQRESISRMGTTSENSKIFCIKTPFEQNESPNCHTEKSFDSIEDLFPKSSQSSQATNIKLVSEDDAQQDFVIGTINRDVSVFNFVSEGKDVAAKENDAIQPMETISSECDKRMADLPQNDAEFNISTVTLETSHPKEVSPKKTVPKFTPLLSPPDRRLTNNSSSPTLRPKPSAHLTGRGAQLINMIRNKKLDTSTQCAPTTPISKACMSNIRGEKAEIIPPSEHICVIGTEQASAVLKQNDLLLFSKRLPPSTASPSASILKRKLRRDSIDDISADSPAFKRKRVSFHDPPVSLTKEYLRDSNENETKPKRCLVLDKIGVGQTSEAKHTLKRKSKLDSFIEIEKYSSEPSNKATSSPITPTCKPTLKTPSVDVDLLCPNNRSDPSNLECSKNSQMNAEAALNFVAQNYSLEDVLDKYFSVENTSQKSVNLLARFVSNLMNTKPKMKASVLETLSENHSKDFLDHAVQENLSSVVCDRLNLNSVIDYICAKSKINTNCRNSLLLQIPDILNHSKMETEHKNFISNILQSTHFTDTNLLDIISLLTRARSADKNNSESVSESAIDSSTAL